MVCGDLLAVCCSCSQLYGPASPLHMTTEAALSGTSLAAMSTALPYEGPQKESAKDPSSVGAGLEEVCPTAIQLLVMIPPAAVAVLVVLLSTC
jgi:hypothetical protein